MPDGRITDRAWFTRHPVIVAWDLIGCVVRIERDGAVVAGRIVETEAYAGPADPASHAGRLKVARKALAGPPGTVYTYVSYGIHNMLNFVGHEDGKSGGILIRALEPLEGLDAMRHRRGDMPDAQLCKGPGSLGQALGIRLSDLGTDLLASPAFEVLCGDVDREILASPRIGISRAVNAPWRFFVTPSPCVSAHRRGVPVTRDEVPSLIPPPGTPIE